MSVGRSALVRLSVGRSAFVCLPVGGSAFVCLLVGLRLFVCLLVGLRPISSFVRCDEVVVFFFSHVRGVEGSGFFRTLCRWS